MTKKDTQPKANIMTLTNKRDIMVEIMNNTNGNFFYKCPKSGMQIDLAEFGDREEISFEHLISMKNKYKVMLEDMWVLITDVFSDVYTKEDVIKALGLTRFYKDKDLGVEFIDNLILEASKEEFENTLNQMNDGFKQRVSERAVGLFKEEEFADIFKMRLLMKIVKDENLFEI